MEIEVQHRGDRRARYFTFRVKRPTWRAVGKAGAVLLAGVVTHYEPHYGTVLVAMLVATGALFRR
ncbi:hypothetical protein [Dactylosporangium sp. CA-139066]|uniref:hypothetical protein n=1 Tax=Dactylosporangium sp. CA-139066 TaxID=3239930 RepID=UPI003D8D2F5A